MTDPKNVPPDFPNRRQRAEERITAESLPPEELSPDQAVRLIHELQVRQIELERQNDELRRSQAELEKSRNKYADLYDFAPVGYLTLDAQGAIVEANLTAATLLGVERSQLLNRSFTHFLVAADRQLFRRLLNNGLSMKEQQGEVHVRGGNGDARVMLVDILFLTDAEGRERRRVSLTDITELKRTQEELRLHKEGLEEPVVHRTAELTELNEQLHQVNEKLEALFRAAPLAIASFDADGNITSINPAAERLFGWSLEELLSRPPLSIPPDFSEESQALLQRVLDGESIVGVETKQQCKDGTFSDVSVSAAPLHDTQGKLRGFVVLAEDITVQKKAREILAQQTELLDLAHDAILVRDPEGRITYWNQGATQHYGWTREEALGQLSHKLLKTVFPQPLLEIERQLLEEGFWEGEVTHTTRQGRKLTINARWSAKRDQAGRVAAILEINQDITAQKRIEAEVHRLASFPLLNPNPVLEVDENGNVTYANPAGRHLAEKLRCRGGLEALVPPDLRDNFRAFSRGGPHQFAYELNLDGRAYTALLSFSHDLPTARLYAMDITARKLAEEALQKSEERYRSLVELSPDGVMVHAKGRYVFANPAGLKLFGATNPEDLIGRRVLELVHPDSHDTVRQRLRVGERLDIRQVKILRLDGHTTEVEVAATPITYGGQPAIQVVLRDITERKQAEAALIQAKEEWERTFDAVPDLIAILDKDHVITRVNKAMADFLASAPEKVLGRTCYHLVHGRDEVPDFCPHAAVLATGQAANTIVEEFGQILDVTVSPIFAPDGRLIGGVHVARDITEKKRGEEALRESEERYRSLFENNHAVMLLIDPVTGAIVDSNPAASAYYGFSRDELRGRRITDINTLDPEQVTEMMRQAQAETSRHFEFKHRLADGEVRDVEVFSGPIRIKGRELLYSIVHDITARKEAEAALRESEARFRSLFDSLTEGVALHEIIYDDQGATVDYRILATNPAYTKHTGLTAAQVQGRLASEAYGTGQAPYLETFALVADTGQPVSFETFFPPLDRHFHISASSFKTGQFVTVFEDITERKGMEEALRRANDELEARVAERTAALRQANENLADEIQERRKIEDRLRDSEARFISFMEHLPGLAVMRDMEGRYLYANRAWEKAMSLTPGAWQGKSLIDLWDPERALAFQKLDFQIISSGTPFEQIEVLALADGPHHFLTKRFPILDAEGLPYMVGAIAIDVTDRRRAEQQEAETGRLYRILSQVNEAIIRDRDQQSLFEQVCRIVVEEGLFAMAWVGLCDPLSQTVRVAAKYGYDEGYLDTIRIRVLDGPESQGPTGTAIRENRYDVCNDYALDPRMTPWREPGLARGYQSSGAFPLRIGDRVVGVLTMYAPRVGFFTPKEIALLASLADNLSFALESLDREAKRRRAEEALAEQAMLIQDLYNHAPCGYHSLDSEGYYVQINDTELAWLGYDRDEVVGKMNVADLLTPESLRLFQDNFSQLKEKGWIKDLEFDFVRKDGSVFPVLLNATAVTDEAGNFLMSRSTIFDITERKRAEAVIVEQGRQLEAFFAHSLTPLVFLDRDFTFLRVNEAYAQACQKNTQDFPGHNHFEFYPNAENEAIFAEVVRRKTPYQAQAKPFEFPDHPEWGLTYWDWSLTPILDAGGEVDFLVFSLQDVTQRVLTEQARNRLIEILEATPDFVGIADFYGRLQYLNRAGRALVGVGEHEDITPLKVLDLHPPEVGKLILEKGSPTAIEAGVWQAELTLLHRDGREIPVSQVILAHKDASGRVQFFSTVARDISDIKEAQASILRQSAILNGINRIFRETLTCETARELGQSCLAIAETLTNSQFGFIAELNRQGRLDALALTDPNWQSYGRQSVRDLSPVIDLEPSGLLARPLQEGKAVIANAPASEPEWAGSLANRSPLTAYLGMPLIYGGKTLGLLGLGNKEGGYTSTDREAVESLAPAIVEALMHHRAATALKESEGRLRYLADQLLAAQENERKRLAAELHDELGHALLSMKLHLSSIEKKLPPEQEDVKEEIRAQLDYIHEVIQDVRRLYHDLSPGDVEDLGLTKALRTLINDFAYHLPEITWQVELTDMEGLFSLPVQTTIYRILQEALTNIGKHANPNRVTISSAKENNQVRFVVADDGVGFDVDQKLRSRSAGRGVGLVAMEERLNMVGGSLEIQSRLRGGTRLSFTIPAIPEGERP